MSILLEFFPSATFMVLVSFLTTMAPSSFTKLSKLSLAMDLIFEYLSRVVFHQLQNPIIFHKGKSVALKKQLTAKTTIPRL